MDTHTLAQVAVGLGIFALVVYRQMRARQVGPRAVVLPLILLGDGLYTAYLAGHPTGLLDHGHLAASVALLVVGLMVDIGLGAWRATTMYAWRDEQGALWRQGTKLTALAWLVSIGVRIGLVVGAGYLMHVQEPTAVLLLGAGVTLVTQNLFVARRAEHQPSVGRATVRLYR